MATVYPLKSEADLLLQQVKQHPLPRHVAIIMDGNGRWAHRYGKDRTAGHRQGVETARSIVEFCIHELGLQALTLYAFSTENWRRPRREVDFLMELMLRFLREEVERLVGKNVRLRVLGDVSGLPAPLEAEIERSERLSRDNSGLQLNIAVNYGGRQEILRAVRRLMEAAKRGQLEPGMLDEATFARALYTQGQPDPDLVIRTAEQRLSNFLLWQSAYAEFWTTSTLWPEFSPCDLLQALNDYQHRVRTFGNVQRHA